MNTVLVWVLVTTTSVHQGYVVSHSPHSFPTLKDCQQVLENLPGLYGRGVSRCIQTRVVAPK